MLRRLHGGSVLTTTIPIGADFKEAVAVRKPIVEHKPKGARRSRSGPWPTSCSTEFLAPCKTMPRTTRGGSHDGQGQGHPGRLAPCKKGFLHRARRGSCTVQEGVLAPCKKGFLHRARRVLAPCKKGFLHRARRCLGRLTEGRVMAKDKDILERFGANLAESMGGGRSPRPTAPALDDGQARRGVPAPGRGRDRGRADRADPGQPRTEFDPGAIARLAESLEAHGQIQPISVRWSDDPGRYLIVTGERRWRASILAGRPTIAAVILEGDRTDSQVLEMQLVENCLREDLQPIEQARAFRTLMDRNGSTAARLAETLRLTGSSVTRALALLDLPCTCKTRSRRARSPPRSPTKSASSETPNPRPRSPPGWSPRSSPGPRRSRPSARPPASRGRVGRRRAGGVTRAGRGRPRPASSDRARHQDHRRAGQGDRARRPPGRAWRKPRSKVRAELGDGQVAA